MLKYILNKSMLLILLLFCRYGFAQDSDSLRLANYEAKQAIINDTIKPKGLKLDAIRVGADLSGLVNGLFAKDIIRYYSNVYKYELTADAGFNNNRYFAVIDIGYSSVQRIRQEQKTRFAYNNIGQYVRLGVDYNLLRRFFNREVFFTGVRYGFTSFNHRLNYNVSSTPWGIPYDGKNHFGKTEKIPKQNLTGHWAEAVMGLKVNMWRNWFLGYTLRLKVNLGINGETNLVANEMPGYGTTDKRAKLAFNYYVYYRFPFRKFPEVIVD